MRKLILLFPLILGLLTACNASQSDPHPSSQMLPVQVAIETESIPSSQVAIAPKLTPVFVPDYDGIKGNDCEKFTPNNLKALDEITYLDEPLTIDDLLGNEVFVAKSSVKKLQEFFLQSTSVLKNYQERLVIEEINQNETKTVAEIVQATTLQFERPELNTFMLLAILELITDGIVTNPHHEIKNIYPDCHGSIDGAGLPIPDESPLHQLMDCTAFYLQIYREKQYPPELSADEFLYKVKLADNSIISIDKNVNDRTFAVRRLLADFAPDTETYKQWLSFEEGSLYDWYEQWFGFPNEFFIASNTEGERILSEKKPDLFYEPENIKQSCLHNIIDEAAIRFAIPKNIIMAMLVEAPKLWGNGMDRFGMMQLTGAEVMKVSYLTGIPETNIRNSIRANILAEVYLISQKRRILFDSKIYLDLTEWKQIIQEVELDHWRTGVYGNEELDDYAQGVVDEKIAKIMTIIEKEGEYELPNGEKIKMETLEKSSVDLK